jgi:5-methylcytosine-specific restriction endonuclease McrA
MKVEYLDDGKIAVYNGYKFTRDDKTSYYLSTCKIEGRRMRLHVYVFQNERGMKVPQGWQVHHIDEDKSHNDINNLICIPEHNHQSYHSKRKYEENPEAVISVLRSGSEKAKEWHRSQAGREWHKKHYEKMKDNLYEMHHFKCLVCGKEFQSTNVKSKFCCNAHKTKYRSLLGLDDEIRKCAVCGKPFTINKFSKTKGCSKECTKILMRIAKMKAAR